MQNRVSFNEIASFKFNFVVFKEGAQTSIYLSVSEEVTTSGDYYADCRLSACSSLAQDPEAANQLWAKSAELVQLESNETFI
jgi:hypothetical protein